MYENYTYEQVKNLPDEQKIEALKELKVIYPENKILAQHWDVAHIAVSNMVGKYLEGKQVGRKKMTDEEKAQKKIERELTKQQQRAQQNQEENTIKQEVQNIETEEAEIKKSKSINQEAQVQSKSNSFSIKLEKNMTGEETITRLNGIANSLLQENEYSVSLKVEEV